MSKSIALACPKCGKTATFNLEAGASLATLTDVAALNSDVEELLINVMNLQNILTPEMYLFFSQNLADGLTNVNYELFEKKLSLFDKVELEKSEIPPYPAKVVEDIEQSKAKWSAIFSKYGVVAFNAIYQCEKCGKSYNKTFLQIKYILDKKEKLFTLSHKCACGNPLTIVDDKNCGYLNIGLATNLPCECGANFEVDKVSFSK